MNQITTFDDAKNAIAGQCRIAALATAARSEQGASAASSYGGSFYGRHGEPWPVNDGKPLIPWLQVASRELPFRNAPFDALELVTFWIDEDNWDAAFARQDNAPIVVREYASLDGLIQLPRPEGFSGHPHYSLTWAQIADYPCLSHFYRSFSDAVYGGMCDKVEELRLENHSGIKFGGWPSLVAAELRSPVERLLRHADRRDGELDSARFFLYLVGC
jgi:hypothetical protein